MVKLILDLNALYSFCKDIREYVVIDRYRIFGQQLKKKFESERDNTAKLVKDLRRR